MLSKENWDKIAKDLDSFLTAKIKDRQGNFLAEELVSPIIE